MYQDLLAKLYDGYDAHERFRENYKYLMDSIPRINNLWDCNFNDFDAIKLVILGEAPLWGKKKSYFYRDKARQTSFFSCTHLRKGYKIKIRKKEELFSSMIEHGIVILDVLPFPFNPDDTPICYCKPKKNQESSQLKDKDYQKLIKDTFDSHLKPKLLRIMEIAENDIVWVYRYKRVADYHQTIVDLWKKAGIQLPDQLVRISGQKYGIIDQDKLNSVLP